MPEKDDFDSWEPQDMEEGLSQPVAVEQELRQHMIDPDPEKPSARRRTALLSVLLLVVAGAAAYVYLGGSPAPEAPQPAPPARKPIALPPPPALEQATVKTENIAPAPPAVNLPQQTAMGSDAPEKTEVAAVSKPAPEKTAEPAVSAEAASRKVLAAPAPAPSTPAPTKAAPYALQGGAFLLKDNLRAAEATVRRLGYEPQVTTLRRTMPMTRLRVGGFFVKEGEAKLASIKPLAPEAFLIRQDDFVLVYAGTYQDLDRARRAADRLYQQGIRVEEEPTTAEVALSLLTFGSFADRDAAEQAAVKARAAGLEAVVRKAH